MNNAPDPRQLSFVGEQRGAHRTELALQSVKPGRQTSSRAPECIGGPTTPDGIPPGRDQAGGDQAGLGRDHSEPGGHRSHLVRTGGEQLRHPGIGHRVAHDHVRSISRRVPPGK